MTSTTAPPMTAAQASLYQQLRGHLATLKLAACAEALPAVLDQAVAEDWTMTATLERLLAIEVDATEARRLTRPTPFRLPAHPSHPRRLRLRRAALTPQSNPGRRLPRETQSHTFRRASAAPAGAPRPRQPRQRVTPDQRPAASHRARTPPPWNPHPDAHRRLRRARRPRHYRRDHPHPHHRPRPPLPRHRTSDRRPTTTLRTQEALGIRECNYNGVTVSLQ